MIAGWASGFSETTEEKAENALRMVKKAIAASERLKGKGVAVYSTGSYRNNTNTALESDVDIAVVLKDCFFYALPSSGRPTKEDLGFTDSASYGLDPFRNDIGAALTAAFGSRGVTPGNKAFDVHENSYRIDADVATFVQHRRYTGNVTASNSWEYIEGVEMRPRNSPSTRVINWHDQHFENGVSKNKRTSLRFKRAARVLKRIRDDMKIEGTPSGKAAAAKAASFLIESLAYNVPDESYTASSAYDLTSAVIANAWNATKPDVNEKLVEVSGLKWLFWPDQAWTLADAHAFLLEAWKHVEFK